MFGLRSDGRKIKGLTPDFKLMPCLMPERSDSQVFYKQDLPLENMDKFMKEKEEQGEKYSYMSIIYAAMVRLLGQRPHLNRFIMNGRVYARNTISVSLVVKKELSDDGVETPIKLYFRGDETLDQVNRKLMKAISHNKDVATKNSTDKTAGVLAHIPTFLMKFAVKLIWFLDRHGMLPKSLIKASPFHTSAFITNVGSIGLDAIYHHIYNFGTTSLFFSMGKKKKSYVYEDDEMKEEKVITIAFVGDERICDGYYYANSFKQMSKYLKNPKLLEEPIEVVKDIK